MFSEKSTGDKYNPLSNEWNQLMQKYQACSNKIYKWKGIHVIMKKWDKHGSCNDPFPSSYLHLCEKYELEIALLDIQKDDIEKKMKSIWDEMEGLFHITSQNSRLQKISKTQKHRLEKETCSICYDTHPITKSVTTSCGHTFGKCCFSKMIEHNYDNAVETVCPCCRNPTFELIRYVV